MNNNCHHQQQGITLVLSLVILITLTMLGLTSIQTTTTELSMAGNQREASLAFQAAEIGLDDAIKFIQNSTSNADFTNASKGLLTVPRTGDYEHPNYYDDSAWSNESTKTSTQIEAHAQPQYMIEYLGDRSQNPLAIGIGSYGSQKDEIVSIYRPTARGVGLTGNTYRYLQSYFGKVAP